MYTGGSHPLLLSPHLLWGGGGGGGGGGDGKKPSNKSAGTHY
jgi:hypothetical protein